MTTSPLLSPRFSLYNPRRAAPVPGAPPPSFVLNRVVDPRRRDQLKRELKMADRRIAEGRGHIEKQLAIIAELERDGHDSALAKELLATLRTTLKMHEDHR